MTKGPLYLTRSALIAVIVNVVVFALFIVGFQMKPKSSQAVFDPINIVKAEVIDGAAIEQEKKKIRDEEQTRERKKREQEQRKQREAEQKKKQQQAAEKRKEEERQAEVKQAVEEKRVAEDKAKKASQAREKAELEKKQAEQDKKKAEQELAKAEEAKEKAEQERIKAEENAQKLAEQLKKQEQAKRHAEKEVEQKRLDAILEQEDADMRAEQERAAKAARQQELNTLQSQYIGAIQSEVTSRWRKPPGVDTNNAFCKVRIKQAIGGYIEEVSIMKCEGGNDQFRRSVEEAVWKSDPLPAPPDDDVFLREFILNFNPG